MTRKRPLTPEEKKLWEMVTGQIAPLSKQKKNLVSIKAKPVSGGRWQVSDKDNLLSATCHLTPDTLRVAQGNYAGIDRNTADRFRKGDAPIDATLDLHGMTREKAHHALHRFLHTQYERKSRCLLVITGKGTRTSAGAEAKPGVLREALPAWLSDESFASMILAFDTAKPKHGGSGAFYILLKRKR